MKLTNPTTLYDVVVLANELIAEFLTLGATRKCGLREFTITNKWDFEWRGGNVTFGSCRFKPGEGCGHIRLTRKVCEFNLDNPAQIEDTIRHEIAHALAFEYAQSVHHNWRYGDGHGAYFYHFCGVTGATPERCYDHTVKAGKSAEKKHLIQKYQQMLKQKNNKQDE